MGALSSARYFQREDMDDRWKEAIIPTTRGDDDRRDLVSMATEQQHQPQQ